MADLNKNTPMPDQDSFEQALNAAFHAPLEPFVPMQEPEPPIPAAAPQYAEPPAEPAAAPQPSKPAAAPVAMLPRWLPRLLYGLCLCIALVVLGYYLLREPPPPGLQGSSPSTAAPTESGSETSPSGSIPDEWGIELRLSSMLGEVSDKFSLLTTSPEEVEQFLELADGLPWKEELDVSLPTDSVILISTDIMLLEFNVTCNGQKTAYTLNLGGQLFKDNLMAQVDQPLWAMITGWLIRLQENPVVLRTSCILTDNNLPLTLTCKSGLAALYNEVDGTAVKMNAARQGDLCILLRPETVGCGLILYDRLDYYRVLCSKGISWTLINGMSFVTVEEPPSLLDTKYSINNFSLHFDQGYASSINATPLSELQGSSLRTWLEELSWLVAKVDYAQQLQGIAMFSLQAPLGPAASTPGAVAQSNYTLYDNGVLQRGNSYAKLTPQQLLELCRLLQPATYNYAAISEPTLYYRESWNFLDDLVTVHLDVEGSCFLRTADGQVSRGAYLQLGEIILVFTDQGITPCRTDSSVTLYAKGQTPDTFLVRGAPGDLEMRHGILELSIRDLTAGFVGQGNYATLAQDQLEQLHELLEWLKTNCPSSGDGDEVAPVAEDSLEPIVDFAYWRHGQPYRYSILNGILYSEGVSYAIDGYRFQLLRMLLPASDKIEETCSSLDVGHKLEFLQSGNYKLGGTVAGVYLKFGSKLLLCSVSSELYFYRQDSYLLRWMNMPPISSGLTEMGELYFRADMADFMELVYGMPAFVDPPVTVA